MREISATASQSANGSGHGLRRRSTVTAGCGRRLRSPRGRTAARDLFPHLTLDRAKPGLLAVNSAGRRFVNEAVSYHDFVEAMLESHKTVPSIPAYLICDAAFIRKYGLGTIHPGTRNLSKFERSWLSAHRPHDRGAGRQDRRACRGACVTPSRAKTSLQRPGWTSTSARASWSSTVSTAMRATRRIPASAPLRRRHSMRSPSGRPISRSAPDSRPMPMPASSTRRGNPIQGLYACGNDMASVMAGAYPGPGTTLGPAMVFAYRAAMHARGIT